MYRAEDYPNDVSSKYGFAVEYAPVPSGGDFRVQLSQAEIDIIATRTEDRVKDAFEQAHKDAPDAIFRDSLISNASELTDVLSRMNIAGDMNLEALRKQTASLATVQPASLRNDPVTRIQTANQAQGILDSMLAVYGKGIAA
ncbi:unnamed protein product [Sphagnum balticum]